MPRYAVDDWDSWWNHELAQPCRDFDTRVTPFEGMLLVRHARWLWDNGFRRVLCAGNGISIAPLALAHCGMTVVALDISSVATDVVKRWNPSDAEWRFFFQCDEGGQVGDFSEAFHRPGGTVTYVVGDFLDSSVESGPFDFIACWRATQHLTKDGVQVFVERMIGRLSPSGFFHLFVQNDPERCRELMAVLGERGYVINPNPWPACGRFAVVAVASG